MEVFLYNIPSDLTDRALQTQLTQHTKRLGIEDWSCQKPRRKNFGGITFLHLDEGHRFLRQYSGPARLFIFGQPVTCRLSNRGAPDAFLLKSLAKSAEDRRVVEKNPLPPPDPKVVFDTRRLSCGYYDYIHDKLFYSPQVTWDTPKGYAKFAKRALIIEFECTPAQFGKKRIEIPYRIVEALVVSTEPLGLTLTLWEAPTFFHIASPDVTALLASLSLAPQQQQGNISKSRLVALSDQSPDSRTRHQQVIGNSLVYHISVSGREFYEMTKRLKERNVLTIYHHDIYIPPFIQQRDLSAVLEAFNQQVRRWSKIIPFTVLYQIEALVKNGFLLPWTVCDLLERMGKIAKQEESTSSKGFPISATAVKKLFSQIPFPSREEKASTFHPEEIWQYILHNENEVRLGHTQELITTKAVRNLAMIHKVTVTPTGFALHGPDPEAKNRILRRFPNHTEYFIRVQFCDEDGSDLQFNSNVSNEEIFNRFKSIFKNGIPIAGRVYGFLGFSHSSLRSHSAWFMAPFVYENKLQTYFSVINYLGTFDSIKSPARCAARIGQAFSETPVAISLVSPEVHIQMVDDVKSPDGSRVFSDGVGTISQPVMEAIQAVIPRRKLHDGPTCFQIRWGGAKGMLALDARLGDSRIMRVRPSMLKFESTDTENLEICDTANKPIPMVLNRQMIKILEDLGVTPEWFLKRQANALYLLQMITAHVENTVGFLKHQNIATRIGFPQLIRRLYRIDIDYRKDRFLASVVETAVLRELRLLKHKARIPIDKGVTLFGIMDETKYLEEGEIYVTFDDASFIEDRYMDLDSRQMIVTRSPALHPGDIQLATNIIPPVGHPLRELRNCVVFSQKGKRDLPSCLSGGDLDGDVYGIIWDDEAVDQIKRTYEPADYPRVQPLDIGRSVQREDMTDFFIQFMATDQLGLIAVRHMILADQHEEGTVHPQCLLLAEMHSTGVDYSKTGIPVDMTLLKKVKWTRYRPDFLAAAPPANIKNKTEIEFDAPEPIQGQDQDDDDVAGPNHQYYKSEKVNGLLYRAIDEQKIWYENIKIAVDHADGHASNIWTKLLAYIKEGTYVDLTGPNWAAAKKEAWDIRHAYEDAMWNATLEFSDHAAKRITELEVFTGAIYNKSGIQTRRQRDRSVQLKDEFERIAQWAVGMIRKQKFKGATEEDAEEEDTQAGAADPSERLILSIACLQVGILKDLSRLGHARAEEEFQSFKVVAASCALRELDAANRAKEIGGSVIAG